MKSQQELTKDNFENEIEKLLSKKPDIIQIKSKKPKSLAIKKFIQ